MIAKSKEAREERKGIEKPKIVVKYENWFC